MDCRVSQHIYNIYIFLIKCPKHQVSYSHLLDKVVFVEFSQDEYFLKNQNNY